MLHPRSFNGEVMPLSSGVELHVRNFLAEHEGNYSCTATNPLGQVTGSVHLVPVYDLGVSKKTYYGNQTVVKGFNPGLLFHSGSITKGLKISAQL